MRNFQTERNHTFFRLVAGAACLGVSMTLAANEPGEGADPSVCQTPDQELALVHYRYPEYPPMAANHCIEGEVKVQGTVDTSGRVSSVEIVESRPDWVFDEAVETVREWQFRPACRDGRPREREFVQEIEFRPDAAARERCPQELEPDERKLYSELMTIGTRLAMDWMDEPPDAEFNGELPGPGPRFTGDLGRIERFHRDWMVRQHTAGTDMRRQMYRSGWFNLLNAQRLGSDPGLQQSRDILDGFTAAVDAFESRVREHVREAATELERMDLAPELRARFFPSADEWRAAKMDEVEGTVELLRQNHARHSAIIDLLAADEQAWSVTAEGRLRFDHESDQATYRELLNEIQTAYQQHARRMVEANHLAWQQLSPDPESEESSQ